MADKLQARMAIAAEQLLDALDDSQRRLVQLPFEEGGERETWFYTPTDHGGLPLHQMTPRQQQAVHRLVVTGLSRGGYVTAATIMGVENVLDLNEGFQNRFAGLPRSRDPNGYYIAIFGEPDPDELWSWRFAGHHISIHYLVHPSAVRTLPTFFGSNPAVSHGVGPNLLRPLAGEEDLARELLHLLSPDQRERAVLTPAAPRDLVTANRSSLGDGDQPLTTAQLMRGPSTPEGLAQSLEANRRFEEALGFKPEYHPIVEYTSTPKGLPVSELTEAQREALDALLRQYIGRMPDEIAETELARVRAIAPADLAFAWAGSAEPGQPHYYRVQGPELLVEYDNTQNDANHIHSVWRDPRRDFGRDVLAEHYAAAHRA